MRGYKDIWFDEYERLYNEREDGEIQGTDQQLAELAHESAKDKISSEIDRAHDESKDRLIR